jgi:hypothetical protein
VPPGGKITVTDTGWMPDSQVDLELHSDPVNLGSATVGDDGSFSKEVTIPADTPEGTHTIVITGTGDDQQPQTHSVEIKVSSEVVNSGSTTTTTTASGGSGGGSLPFTGGPAMPLLIVSVAMILAGVGLGARRRRDV